MNIKDTIVQAVMPIFRLIGKAYLKQALQSIQTHNSPELYANTLKSINANFLLLDEVAKKTSTKIDDDLIDTVLGAVQESAAEDNIQL